jgi:hypothetical protein
MQIDTEHLHHWMRAIRESKNPMRTMDAFWRGQILSKEWLITELKKQKDHYKKWPTVDIHGGWVGTLASLMFQSDMYISHINSIDIDPDCEKVASTMNQMETEAGKFKAITSDMCKFESTADIIINTSFEHITQEQYDIWFEKIPKDSVVVLQSNNYNIPEHVRIADNLKEFQQQSKLKTILYIGELDLPMYKRYMIIGKKDV